MNNKQLYREISEFDGCKKFKYLLDKCVSEIEIQENRIEILQNTITRFTTINMQLNQKIENLNQELKTYR